jgi:two-component system, OmpR family, response regulator
MDVRSVLIVDDDANIRTVAEIGLELDFIIFMADSGMKALAVAESEKPDLILLDVRMPGMDGPTTLIKLRENPLTANIPVIIMSASVQSQEMESYKKLDVVGVIVKPFDSNEIGRSNS